MMLTFALSVILLFQSQPATAAASADAALETALRAHVEKLASPEFEGRGAGAGKDLARKYIINEFTKIGLKPAGALKSYIAEFKEPKAGQNIVGLLAGADAKLAKEFIIVSAHYDHKGKIGADIFPGADDNASGVAAMLEVAKLLKSSKSAPKRSVLFIAFDLEEAGLLGSFAFIKNPPVPAASIAAFTTMDMLGRDTYNIIDNYLFVAGVEHAESSRAIVKKSFEGTGLKPGIIGTDLIGARSDYAAFAEQKIPYLFFSTGEHQDYHKTSDTPEKINYTKLAKNAQIIGRCAIELANAAARPAWNEQKPDLDEMKAFNEVFHKFKDNAKQLQLDDMTAGMLADVCKKLDEIVKVGTVTPGDRQMLKTLVETMMGAMR